MKKITVFFISLFLIPATQALFAEPKTSIKFQNYQISGATEEELRESMRRSSPATGGHFAFTNWNIHWNYKYAQAGDGCRLTSSQVSLDVTYRMPEWRGAESASGKLKSKWKKFSQALQTHEDGHKNTGVDAAAMVEKNLQGLGVVGCGEIDPAVRRAAQTAIQAYKAKEIEYDRKTEHGKNQGAWF